MVKLFKKDSIMYIYVITNKVNGKQYVGKSIHDPEGSTGRLKWHFTLQGKGVNLLHRAIKKYGKDNFDYEIIPYPGVSEEKLAAIEKKYIEKLGTYGNGKGYNQTIGGEGSSGYTHTQEYLKNKSMSTRRKSDKEIHKVLAKNRKKIIILHEKGLSSTEIATLFNCGSSFIQNILTEEGKMGHNERQDVYCHREDIEKLYASGWTLRELADKYKCSLDPIMFIIDRANITRKNKRNQKIWEKQDELVELYNSGLTLRQITERYPASLCTIRRVINEKTEIRDLRRRDVYKQKDKILLDYNSGQTIRQLASKYECSFRTIDLVLRGFSK